MERPRLYKTEALVLRSTPLGEADRLITLYTPTLGKIRATARGVRRSLSKMGGHLDMLNRVSLGIARGQNLDVITGAEAAEVFRPLKESVERTAQAFYLAELVDAFAPEEAPNPTLYTLLHQSLRALESGNPSEVVLRYFDLRLLELSGFMPELQRCVQCRKELSPTSHAFSPVAGGVVCDACAPQPAMLLSLETLKVLRYLARSTLAEALRLHLHGSVAQEVEAVLGATIVHTLEREVRSTAFLEHLRRLRIGDLKAASVGASNG